MKFNQGTGVFDIQANLKVAKDANYIEFEDSGIKLSDYGYDSPYQNYQKKDVAFWTSWSSDSSASSSNSEIQLVLEDYNNAYSSTIEVRASTEHLVPGPHIIYYDNSAQLYSNVDMNGFGYSGIKLGCCAFDDIYYVYRKSWATIKSALIWNLSYQAVYLDFNSPIYFSRSLVPELLANYPNGTLGRDTNGKLMFKQGGTWFAVAYQPTNTTSTSDETTEPTFPKNPVDGDYHEHTYTGETPNKKTLYIYKFGKWYGLAAIFE
ncbi:MAG: hypothetical protein APG08_01588 [Candidatus Methanofastidiosum methylothiophilum]|nr:MAG: hypothetical protein APG08_01588 [Candidatus Methanofastidiosum methylthiophilus]